MKLSKKLLSVLLAIMMVVSMGSITVYAASDSVTGSVKSITNYYPCSGSCSRTTNNITGDTKYEVNAKQIYVLVTGTQYNSNGDKVSPVIKYTLNEKQTTAHVTAPTSVSSNKFTYVSATHNIETTASSWVETTGV